MVTYKMASEDVEVVQEQSVPDRAMLRAGLEGTRHGIPPLVGRRCRGKMAL